MVGQNERTVLNLLQSREWLEALQQRYKAKDGKLKVRCDTKKLNDLIVQAGLPPLKYVAATELLNGKSLPRSNETDRITDAKDIDPNNDVLFFVSHRWLRPREGDPDDHARSKARALSQFAIWWAEYDHMKEKRLNSPNKVYFWLDYACIEQDNRELMNAGISSLPLYASTCGSIVECMKTTSMNDEYYTRAWCMVEAAIAYRFQLGGGAPFILPVGWTFDQLSDEDRKALLVKKTKGQINDLKAYAREYVKVEDRIIYHPLPKGGNLKDRMYDTEDKKYIVGLLATAESAFIKFPERKEKNNELILDETTAKARVLIQKL